MKIVISSGHGKYIRGASGYIDEVDEARLVVEQVADVLKSMDIEVITYHDNVSDDQSENLGRICDFHNSIGAHDLDVSVHFNSTGEGYRDEPVGCEVFYASTAGSKYADQIVDKICTASGLKNRGPKEGNLSFLQNTNEVAVLVEVCFVDSRADCNIYAAKFPEICTAIAEGITGEEADWQPDPGPRPEPEPPEPPGPDVDSHPTLKKGDEGEAVARLQRSLGIPPDGDFGSITDTQVRAFQAACELDADGIVGPNTWAEVETLNAKMLYGDDGVPDDLKEDINRLVVMSELDDYEWDDRGISPPGYISGMSFCFAVVVNMFKTGKASASAMAKPVGDSDIDALAWYKDQFKAKGMTNDTQRDRLRHLFVLLIGLGMRESSGKYCEGRDMSAENTSADTCEAGLFQSSWNFHNASSYIEEFLMEYWADPNGFLETFSEDIYPSANNLNVYGTGEGATYQWLAKFCPAFAVMSTAIGLRTIRQHWGPINRHEVDIVPEVDELLKQVQELIEDGGSSEIA